MCDRDDLSDLSNYETLYFTFIIDANIINYDLIIEIIRDLWSLTIVTALKLDNEYIQYYTYFLVISDELPIANVFRLFKR